MNEDREYTVTLYQTFHMSSDYPQKELEFWNYSVHVGDGKKPGSLIIFSGRSTFDEAVSNVKKIISKPPTPCICSYDGEKLFVDNECLIHGENAVWKIEAERR